MILGTRDWEGNGMLGDELDDFKLDLSGSFRGEGTEVGDCRDEEERGKGIAFNLSRRS